MKMQSKNFLKPILSISSLFIISVALLFTNCDSNDIKGDQAVVIPPDFSKESGLEYFYPDSGGLATQLVLKGHNLGSDTSYLKVTVNGKNAQIVGAANDYVYAIVPARADTGEVKLLVGKGDNIRELTGDKLFKYLFKRNVLTLSGSYGNRYEDKKTPIDGSFSEARYRRPWSITNDSEGALYVVEEGRGREKNGSLRRLFQGVVETLVQNNEGAFQSPNQICFSVTEDTLFIANMSGDGVNTLANIIFSTRESNFNQWKNFTLFSGAQTTGVAVNPKTGELFFNSQSDGYIYKYNPEMPDKRERLAQVNNANGTELRMMFNPQGTELVLCVANRHCIYKAKYNLATKTLETPQHWVGQWGSDGYVNGKGIAAKFKNPYEGDFDEDGNFYVTERENHIIRKITPDGETSLWAGTPGSYGNKDGLPEVALMRNPQGLTRMKSDGALYVTERDAHVIRRIVVE